MYSFNRFKQLIFRFSFSTGADRIANDNMIACTGQCDEAGFVSMSHCEKEIVRVNLPRNAVVVFFFLFCKSNVSKASVLICSKIKYLTIRDYVFFGKHLLITFCLEMNPDWETD